MTVKLNVLITLSFLDKTFSVWSEPMDDLPRIELYVGNGASICDAVDDWYAQIPERIFIDDETTVSKTSITYKLARPFKVEKGNHPRILHVC